MTNIIKKTSTAILIAVFLSTMCLAMVLIPSKVYADSVPYEIGDKGPAGGRVFYDKGDDLGGWRYLEAAPSDQTNEDQINWYINIPALTNATATAIGTGQANTQTIFDVFGVNDYAAFICYNLVLGGYDDWFLPSKDELYEMYLHQDAIGGFEDTGYWSSSEYDADWAWYLEFGSYPPTFLSINKNSWESVRAVRAFSGMKDAGGAAERPWVRTMPMTCARVWINEDNKFQFIFWYPYKDNNWVKIYDINGIMVYEIDMPYDNPNLIVDLPDGIYTVKTYRLDPANPIQTFLIGKP